MASITVIVTADNIDEAPLRYTLESLVEQTVEDFDVILVDNGSDNGTADIFRQYCDDYDGFSVVTIEKSSIPAARNAGVCKARTDFVLFLDGGDYISPETVEQYRKTQEATKADLLVGRYYYSGDTEPNYNDWADKLVVVPDIDRLDRALLQTADLDGALYSRKFFDLYSLRFPDIPVAYNAALKMKCALSGAKTAGCAGAIYDKRISALEQHGAPDETFYRAFTSVYDEIKNDIYNILTEETGALDGDEYSWQEINSVYFQTLTDVFYRRFWYIDDTVLGLLRTRFEALSEPLTEERKKSLNNANADLRYPAMYITHADAALMPMFSLLIDIDEPGKLEGLINSLYAQKFPFFEIWIRESDMKNGTYPEKWKSALNLHVLPDAGFFGKARTDCAGIPINVKDETPLDSRVLQELATAKLPKTLFQYKFAQLRKQHSVKKYLKNKGINMR